MVKWRRLRPGIHQETDKSRTQFDVSFGVLGAEPLGVGVGSNEVQARGRRPPYADCLVRLTQWRPFRATSS